MRVHITHHIFYRIARECRIILATYGIFDTGTDIPRLDCGIEATPRSKLAQALGRILRTSRGKSTPIWFGIEDYIKKPRLTHFGEEEYYDDLLKRFRSRRRSYAQQRATIRELRADDV